MKYKGKWKKDRREDGDRWKKSKKNRKGEPVRCGYCGSIINPFIPCSCPKLNVPE